MRYAIVSDLHANIRAWEAVLADLRAQEADVIVCLGDVVGYGPKPAEVLQAVRAETELFVLGNHDAAAVNMIDYSIFNDHARQAIEWTMTELDEEEKQFLASVPLAIEAEAILFVHAEISEPGRFDYIDCLERAKSNFESGQHFVTFVGHTHIPKIYKKTPDGEVIELADDDKTLNEDSRYIVNVGSVGEPRNPDDLRARYVIYDTETRQVEFRRVEFDIPAYRQDLESTMLSLRPFFLRMYEYVVEGREVAVSSGCSLQDMKVAHNAASLVDLSKVSSLREITNPAVFLKSAQPSKTPMRIFIGTAVLVLGLVLFWMLSSSQKEPDTNAVLKYRDDEESRMDRESSKKRKPLDPLLTGEVEIFSVNIFGAGKPEFWKDQAVKKSVILQSSEIAGAPGWEARRWVNLTDKDRYRWQIPPLPVMGTKGAQIEFEIINHRNFATFHWEKTRDDSDAVSVPNAKMLDGHSDSVESETDKNKAAPFPRRAGIMAFSKIPFETYDVAVYFGSHGSRQGTSKAYIQVNDEISGTPSTGTGGVMFKVAEKEPDGSFTEIKKSGDEGNFIVYRNLTLPTFVLQTWGEANNRIGVAGIQIRGKGKRKDTSISRSKSSLKATATTVVVNDKKGIPFQVVAKSSLGKPIPGILVSPALAPGSSKGSVFPPKAQTNEKGVASFSLTTTEAGKVVLSAKGKANGKAVTFGKLEITSKKDPNAQDPSLNDSNATVKKPVTTPANLPQAYFRAEKYEPGNAIVDQSKSIELVHKGSGAAPKLIPDVGPSEIPLTRAENTGALQIQSSYWEEAKPQKYFNLKRDKSFACEAWIKTIKTEGTVFLFGNRTTKNNEGWMVYLKGKKGSPKDTVPAFFYQAGGKVHQAVGPAGLLNDFESHHIAAVWDHDASSSEGKMSLLVNGKEVATTMVKQSAIGGSNTNPFSIGGAPNKGQVRGLGIDEIRFTQKALGKSKLLTYAGVKGARLIGNAAGSEGIWNNPANWEENKIPSNSTNAVIDRGLQVTITKENKTPYEALLVLEEGARLHFDTIGALKILPATSKQVVLQNGAEMVFTCDHCRFPNPIKVEGAGTIYCGLGKDGETKNRRLEGTISGEGSLSVFGTNAGQLIITETNTFSGGFTAQIKEGGCIILAAKEKCLGTGDVTIKKNVSLIAPNGVENFIDDSATLKLEGRGAPVPGGPANRRYTKVQLSGDETVGGFIVDGNDQGEGSFDAQSHPSLIAGTGKLIVKKP